MRTMSKGLYYCRHCGYDCSAPDRDGNAEEMCPERDGDACEPKRRKTEKPMLFSTGYKWTKSSRAVAKQLKVAGGPTPITWLQVREHLRLDAIQLLEKQMLVHFVRNGVIELTARGQIAVKAPGDPSRAERARKRGA